MAVINTNKISMLMVVAALAVICGGKRQCAMADAACDRQILGLILNKCVNYVLKDSVIVAFQQGTPQTEPSAECCVAVKAVTIDCACTYVTPITELLFDVNKVIYVAQTCGRPIPQGTKCNSVTVP